MQDKRGSWGSNFGFLMAAIGSAVGLGNIWGFPFKMGKGGGFAFLLIYIICVIFIGFGVMLGELALGRKTGSSAVGAYAHFSRKHKWVGYLGVISAFVLLAFYCVLGGLVLRYMVGFFLQLLGLDGFAGQGLDFFGSFVFDNGGILFFLGVFVLLSISIVGGGIKGGIEKFTVYGMPALFFLLVFVAVYVAFQPGAIDGYKYMFEPNFDVFKEPGGFLAVLKLAAGQMFFSLSLGMGAMITYGSYLPKEHDLQRNAFIIPIADTIMALLAGCAVMPACAAFGIDFGGGPGLLFVSMHTAFTRMGTFGNFVGMVFYFLVFIAAITSSISLLEVCVSYYVDKELKKGKPVNRYAVVYVCSLLVFIAGLPVALDALGSGNATVKAPYEILGMTLGDASTGYRAWNASWLDFFDMISEGVLMPFGALVMSLLIGWKYKTKTIYDECEVAGIKFKGKAFFDVCFKFIVPIGVAFVLFSQVRDFFG